MWRLIKQIASFVVVGGIATGLDFSLVWGLNQQLGWHYLLASALAFALATIFNYWASMRYTFNSKFSANQKTHEFLLFVALSVAGLLLTLGLMWLAVDWLNWPVMWAKLAVTAVVMVFNFTSRKYLIEGH